MAIPRLIGPALLTLAFYLWDALHGSVARAPPRLTWLWQIVLLAVLGVPSSIAWNLLLRG